MRKIKEFLDAKVSVKSMVIMPFVLTLAIIIGHLWLELLGAIIYIVVLITLMYILVGEVD